MIEANAGDAMAYGADEWTAGDRLRCARRSAPTARFLVLTGSGANVLGSASCCARHEAVICAESAHINTDECGGPSACSAPSSCRYPRRTGNSRRT